MIRALWSGGPVTRPSPLLPARGRPRVPDPDPAAADHHRRRDAGRGAPGRPDRRRLERVRGQLRAEPAALSRGARGVGPAARGPAAVRRVPGRRLARRRRHRRDPLVPVAARDLAALARGRRRRGDRPRPDDGGRRRAGRCDRSLVGGPIGRPRSRAAAVDRRQVAGLTSDVHPIRSPDRPHPRLRPLRGPGPAQRRAVRAVQPARAARCGELAGPRHGLRWRSALAVVGLAARRPARRAPGSGRSRPRSVDVRTADDGAALTVTLTVTNSGTSLGSTTCRLSDPGLAAAARRHSSRAPRIAARRDARRSTRRSSGFGTASAAARRRVLHPVTARRARAFATDLARIGRRRILMDRYERVERVDYKSARDIVTEVDHLSEELIIAAIRERFPGDGDPRRGVRSSTRRATATRRRPGSAGSGSSTRSTGRSTTPTASRSSACRSRSRSTAGRPSGVVLDPTRDELFAATVDGPATLDGEPIDAIRQGQAVRLRRADGALGPIGRLAGAGRPQADPDLALDGLVGAGAGLRRERPVRRVHPAGRDVELGRRRGRPDRGASRGDRDRDGRRPVVRHRRASRGRSGRLPRRRPTTRRCSP